MVFRYNVCRAFAAFVLLSQISGIFASPYKVNAPLKPDSEPFSKRSFGISCDGSFNPTCLKLDFVSFIESVSEASDYAILPGLSLVKEDDVNKTKTSEKVAELARSYPNDPDKRLDSYIIYKVGSFLDTHSLKFKLIDDDAAKDALGLTAEDDGSRGLRYGGGLGGKKRYRGGKGGMGTLIAMAMMMKGTLGAIAFGGLALLAGKALMTSLLALMLSAILGLKALTSGGHKSTTYEIVAKPTYSQTHSHSSAHEDYHADHHGSHGYGRSIDIQLPAHLAEDRN